MFVCGQMDGWSECDCEKERKAKGRMEGGVDHLILCSKKQRCSLQMSAAFSSAQMKKKSPQKRTENRRRGGEPRVARFTGSFRTVARCRKRARASVLLLLFFLVFYPSHPPLPSLAHPTFLPCLDGRVMCAPRGLSKHPRPKMEERDGAADDGDTQSVMSPAL